MTILIYAIVLIGFYLDDSRLLTMEHTNYHEVYGVICYFFDSLSFCRIGLFRTKINHGVNLYLGVALFIDQLQPEHYACSMCFATVQP